MMMMMMMTTTTTTMMNIPNSVFKYFQASILIVILVVTNFSLFLWQQAGMSVASLFSDSSFFATHSSSHTHILPIAYSIFYPIRYRLSVGSGTNSK